MNADGITPQHDRRVERILSRARQETCVRDLVTFSLARIWTVVLVIAAMVYALVDRHDRRTADSADSIPSDRPS